MEQMVRVARLLRVKERFGGYIHLKAVPGASEELVLEAGRWADRLSANLELAREADLAQLAPAKSHREIETSMREIADGILNAKDKTMRNGKTPRFVPAGQSTQFIVGATAAPDGDTLSKSSSLYKNYGLRRVYYSAFSPIPHADPALPLKSIPLIREHRLYQADWLIRFYGFSATELTTETEPNLALDKDPKLAWALRHREFFPVDVNRAGKSALLRVPGFGVRNVQRILRIRRYRRLTMSDLGKLKVAMNRARSFVVTADHNPALQQLDSVRLPEQLEGLPYQLRLFEAGIAARTGEL
jgi:putative DNA modification/repair radical SAM protein